MVVTRIYKGFLVYEFSGMGIDQIMIWFDLIGAPKKIGLIWFDLSSEKIDLIWFDLSSENFRPDLIWFEPRQKSAWFDLIWAPKKIGLIWFDLSRRAIWFDLIWLFGGNQIKSELHKKSQNPKLIWRYIWIFFASKYAGSMQLAELGQSRTLFILVDGGYTYL